MMNKNTLFSGILLTVVAVGQIILAFLLYNPEGNPILINIGWGIMVLSAVFGWLPIFTFRKRGGVAGRGYMRTTVLVDSGVYRIVRHPQYLAGVLMGIALPMISQNWIVVVLGIIAVLIYYFDTFEEEKSDIEKFGDEYRQYMEQVPRLNFIAGIFRVLRRH